MWFGNYIYFCSNILHILYGLLLICASSSESCYISFLRMSFYTTVTSSPLTYVHVSLS